MREIKEIISEYYQGNLTESEAEEKIESLGGNVLAEFILDAFNLGWVTKFNLGLNEDGEVI